MISHVCPLHISCFPIFLRKIHTVHDRYFTSKASSSEIFKQKYVTKYQHEDRFQPRKCHIDIEMIRKCKYQMACNPSHINHLLKNTNSSRDTIPHKIKPSTQYNKEAKNSKKYYGHAEMMHPPENCYMCKTFYP